MVQCRWSGKAPSPARGSQGRRNGHSRTIAQLAAVDHCHQDRCLGEVDRSQGRRASRLFRSPADAPAGGDRGEHHGGRGRGAGRDSWGRRGRCRRLGGNDRRRRGPAGTRRSGLTRKQRKRHSKSSSFKSGIPMRPITLTLKGFRGIRDELGRDVIELVRRQVIGAERTAR
jgi:hypothetical protein